MHAKVRRESVAGYATDETLVCGPKEHTRWWQRYKGYLQGLLYRLILNSYLQPQHHHWRHCRTRGHEPPGRVHLLPPPHRKDAHRGCQRTAHQRGKKPAQAQRPAHTTCVLPQRIQRCALLFQALQAHRGHHAERIPQAQALPLRPPAAAQRQAAAGGGRQPSARAIVLHCETACSGARYGPYGVAIRAVLQTPCSTACPAC